MQKSKCADRSWDVLLIGGASGVGKSNLSYEIARQSTVVLTEVDDLYITLEALTTAEQLPDIHFRRTQPAAAESMTVPEIVDLQTRVSRLLSPAIAAVVANHLETDRPMVLEGDYVLPEVVEACKRAAGPSAGRVQAAFLLEDDAEQLVQNFLVREPAAGRQETRAHVSLEFGRWLGEECALLGIPALQVRPWDSLAQRVQALLG